MHFNRNAQIELCWRVLESAQYTVLDDLGYSLIPKTKEDKEWKDLRQFTAKYLLGVTRQEYNDVVFMYACFNLLFLGEEI